MIINLFSYIYLPTFSFSTHKSQLYFYPDYYCFFFWNLSKLIFLTNIKPTKIIMEKKGHLRQSTLKGKNFTFFNLLFWKDRKRKRKKFGKEREREREDLTYLYFWRESLKLTLSNRSNKLIEATKNCLSLSLSLSSSYLLSLSLSLSLYLGFSFPLLNSPIRGESTHVQFPMFSLIPCMSYCLFY